MDRERASEDVKVNLNIPGVLLFSFVLAAAGPAWAATSEETECLLPETLSGLDSGEHPRSEKEHFEHSHAEAVCFRKAAAKAGAEWLKTEGLLVRSTAEADKGNWTDAIQLVQKARFQAETALRQSEYEALAWKRRVIQK